MGDKGADQRGVTSGSAARNEEQGWRQRPERPEKDGGQRLEVLRNSRSRVGREEGKGWATAVRGGTLEADCRDSQNVGNDKVQGAH